MHRGKVIWADPLRPRTEPSPGRKRVVGVSQKREENKKKNAGSFQDMLFWNVTVIIHPSWICPEMTQHRTVGILIYSALSRRIPVSGVLKIETPWPVYSSVMCCHACSWDACLPSPVPTPSSNIRHLALPCLRYFRQGGALPPLLPPPTQVDPRTCFQYYHTSVMTAVESLM